MFRINRQSGNLLVILTALSLLIAGSVLADSAPASADRSSAFPQPAQTINQIKDRVIRMATGVDVQLGGSREPAVAVDPNNPDHVAYSSLWESRVSTDGGDTWTAPQGAVVDAGQGQCGDPSLVYDSQGRLFWTYLGCDDPNDGIDIYLARLDPTTGAVMAGYPVNVTSTIGLPASAGNDHDKEWLAVDNYPTSPYEGNLYIAWTDLTGASTVKSVVSSDQGMTWSAPVSLSGGGEGFVWPCHNFVAPNGDYYVAYHSQTGWDGDAPNGTSGKIYCLRSTDGGGSFPQKNTPFSAGEADISFNRQTEPGAIPGTQFWMQGAAQPWVLADPNTPGRIYVVAGDDPDNDHSSGDPANVYMVTSTDYGVNWSAPARIDGDPGTALQTMPAAGIDYFSGRIAVTYYDTRAGALNDSGRFLLDVYLTYSEDGGATFASDFTINDDPFDPDRGARNRYDGPPPTTRIGEYNGVTSLGCDIFAVWAGNTFDGLGNAVAHQVIFDRVRIDNEDPVAICPADITQANDVDLCSAVVNFTVDATDNCDGVTVSASPPSGSTFPVGITQVTVTATDEAGNTDVCYFDVTVQDTQSPVISCPPDYVFECDNVGSFGYPTATDNCDPSPTIDLIVRDSIPGDCPQEYRIELTYRATDDAGNTDECMQTITVEDTTPPVITCPDPDSLEVVFINPNQAQVFFEVTATDNCDDDPTITSDSLSGAVWEIGDHTVTATADDGCGNYASCSFSFHLVYFDIHPTSCPNPLNVKPYTDKNVSGPSFSLGDPPSADQDDNFDADKANGVFPVAILGTDLLDVRDLAPESITINGVSPIRWAYEDVATPAYGNYDYCGCTRNGRDGYTDLTLKFDAASIVASLGTVADGDVIQLIITGDHVDHDPFFGGDCIIIRGDKSLASAEPLGAGDDMPTTSIIGANPNPFNPATTISFSLSHAAQYRLTIYNIMGQVVRSFEGDGQRGVNQVSWDASDKASGVYFYRLDTDGYSASKKMLLMK